MRFNVLAGCAMGVALIAPSLSLAQDVLGYFDGVIAKLSEQGYREARLVDAEARRIGAYDSYGSEVSLIIDAHEGTIQSWDYVNMRDN